MQRFAPLAVLGAVLFVIVPVQAQRSDSVVKTTARAEKAGNKVVVVVRLDIKKGWHLYANPVMHAELLNSQTLVKVLGVDAKAVAVEYPAGSDYKDKAGEKYKVYKDQTEIRVTVERPPGSSGALELSVRLSACDDNSCLQPVVVRVSAP